MVPRLSENHNFSRNLAESRQKPARFVLKPRNRCLPCAFRSRGGCWLGCYHHVRKFELLKVVVYEPNEVVDKSEENSSNFMGYDVAFLEGDRESCISQIKNGQFTEYSGQLNANGLFDDFAVAKKFLKEFLETTKYRLDVQRYIYQVLKT